MIGHDTTASAISWILFSLAENPDYQIECQEEIDRVISETKDGDLGWYDTIKIFSLTDLSPSLLVVKMENFTSVCNFYALLIKFSAINIMRTAEIRWEAGAGLPWRILTCIIGV